MLYRLCISKREHHITSDILLVTILSVLIDLYYGSIDADKRVTSHRQCLVRLGKFCVAICQSTCSELKHIHKTVGKVIFVSRQRILFELHLAFTLTLGKRHACTTCTPTPMYTVTSPSQDPKSLIQPCIASAP